MIVALVILVASIVIGIIFAIRDRFAGDFLLVVAFGLMIILFFNLFASAAPRVAVADDPIDLYSLRNNSEIEGSFFLGIGTIGETQNAFYSIKEPDGAIIFRHVPLEEIRIYEDDPASPYLQTYHCEFAKPWVKYVFLSPIFTTCDKQDEFHIPTGSVFQGYSIK